MATRPEVVALTEAYRVAQNRRAALIAALVVQWWRTRVRIDDPASVERWLNLMVPRIIAEFNRSGRLAEEFYARLQKADIKVDRALWERELRKRHGIIRGTDTLQTMGKGRYWTNAREFPEVGRHLEGRAAMIAERFVAAADHRQSEAEPAQRAVAHDRVEVAADQHGQQVEDAPDDVEGEKGGDDPDGRGQLPHHSCSPRSAVVSMSSARAGSNLGQSASTIKPSWPKRVQHSSARCGVTGEISPARMVRAS